MFVVRCPCLHGNAVSLCVASVMGGRPFVWLAYSTTMCLLDSVLVSQWPDAVMSQRAQTVA